MNKDVQPASDMLSRTATSHRTVEERIEKRLDVLREWARDGLPHDKAVPKSLRAARLWADGDLGIEPINSPNDFTTTHRSYGTRVRDISILLTEIRKKSSRTSCTTTGQAPKPVSKFDRKDFDRQLEAAVSQWHTEREQRLREAKRADSAEARSVVLLEENAQKDELIADLRRQLAAVKRFRVME
ncbi:hypothetical protein FIU86_06675 [Roseovarius sp. THAF9]|uniref:hypothetical protein n=1 Tax=Roseovarius sp. THAF9 TaxID=2587847 RepID=UPI001267F3A6|nr:hypothetical protein [Roseovarius sp. THAF9]QFT92518.1 hypothetical protein FIU86_06675 [Roseovarius sp. THAF9]